MFVSKYKCSDCSCIFERKTEHDPRKKGRTPSCPECKKNKHPILNSISKSNVEYTQEKLDANCKDIVESRQAPSMGKSNFTKAMDATANIVMKDYGMTNLQDNLRVGDSMAPKLRPELERQVDSVFSPKKPIMGQQAAGSINNALMSQISAGRFAGQTRVRDIAAQAQEFGQARKNSTGYAVPTDVILDNNRIPT